jgi:hypothetical protein
MGLKWTPRDDRRLVRRWALHGFEKAAADLGRSEGACKMRLHVLLTRFPELFADLPLRIVRRGSHGSIVHPLEIPEPYRLGYAHRLLQAEGIDCTSEQAEAALKTIFRDTGSAGREAA